MENGVILIIFVGIAVCLAGAAIRKCTAPSNETQELSVEYRPLPSSGPSFSSLPIIVEEDENPI